MFITLSKACMLLAPMLAQLSINSTARLSITLKILQVLQSPEMVFL